MKDLFKLNYKYSDSHLVVPRIIGGILILLAVLLVIERAKRCKKEGKPFFDLKGYRFFEKNYSKLKFWGSLAILAAYFALLEVIHFLPASLIFIFLLNVLYDDSINLAALFGKAEGPVIRWKPLLTSAMITVVFSVGVWYLFGTVFNITLP
ncbi:MAG: tripartite tricarboxylate transporter TctB family protein [Clostridiales bacterium]|nr:tripartite tricarboxylate transporter TctB family protein [Clostridiales bacterium]